MKKVFVGMSGGVDSSLTAALLVEAGYDVTGVYMKNWAQDIAGFHCPWRDDLTDAKRVAVQLGIKFDIFDFQKQYKQKVVDYMLDGYKQGVTPNPDIMCNQEIKFKLFLDAALERGADLIATGHYAQTKNGKLLTAVDESKDQTYFLYRVSSQALNKTLFPLGGLKKSEVRTMATKRGLVTADKEESMGICFVGKIGIKDFINEYIDTEPGSILDQDGSQIGSHDGAIFYTIGQRHGLNVGGGLPYYVVDKDIKANTVTVTTSIDDERLWTSNITLTRCHWINQPPKINEAYQVRTRHGGKLLKAELSTVSATQAKVILDKEERAITPGQSVVIYDQNHVIGGGIVTK